MSVQELRRLHEDYRAAVTAARDESLDEPARIRAGADLVAKREALDLALIENEQEREDEQRMAAAEARDHAAKKLTDVQPKVDSGLPVDEIRAFAKGEGPGFSKVLPFEARTDITNETSTTYGGYLVPQTWASEVVNFQIAASGVLKAGPTVITTDSGNQINMPILVTDATSVAGTEGTAATQSNVVFGTAPLNAYRFDGYFSVSNELLADSAVDIAPLLREYASRSIAAKVNPYFADPDVGTGSSTIAAVQIGSATGKTSALSTTTNLDDWKELMYSVLPQYRMSGRAAWVANSAETLAMALRRDDVGQYIWSPSNTAAEPDRLWGYPWFEDAYMDTTASGNEPGFFGDLKSAYVVRYAHGGMQFIVSKEVAVTSFETTFVWGLFTDAVTVDTLAVKSLLMT
jgi:HK97 family phage major capsid protein